MQQNLNPVRPSVSWRCISWIHAILLHNFCKRWLGISSLYQLQNNNLNLIMHKISCIANTI